MRERADALRGRTGDGVAAAKLAGSCMCSRFCITIIILTPFFWQCLQEAYLPLMELLNSPWASHQHTAALIMTDAAYSEISVCRDPPLSFLFDSLIFSP